MGLDLVGGVFGRWRMYWVMAGLGGEPGECGGWWADKVGLVEAM